MRNAGDRPCGGFMSHKRLRKYSESGGEPKAFTLKTHGIRALTQRVLGAWRRLVLGLLGSDDTEGG